MATRTAKGTASSKTSGTTLTISDVSLTEGASIVVALGYDDAQGHPTSVKWGNRNLRSRLSRDPGGYDIAHSVWTVGQIKKTGTRDLVATWSGSITERAMLAVELMGTKRIDVRAGNNDSVVTTTPTTGATGAASTMFSFAFAFFVSEGPSTDTVTSGTIDDDGTPATAASGQRTGTTGAPPASNVTIQEMFLELTSSAASQGDLIVGTERKFISSVILMEPNIVHVPYLSRTKDAGGVVMWCDREGVSVAHSSTILHSDGTGVNLNAVTDGEHQTAAITESLATSADVVVLVDE